MLEEKAYFILVNGRMDRDGLCKRSLSFCSSQ